MPGAPTILAVRTANRKLITYPGYATWTELFDLSVDPYETRNLVGFTGSKKNLDEMCTLLQQTLVETGYIARPALDKWLMDFNDPHAKSPAQVSESLSLRRPPLMHPNC